MTSCGICRDPTFEPPRLRLVDITQLHIILFICADRNPSIVFIPQILLLELLLLRFFCEVDVFEESVFLDKRWYVYIRIPDSRLTTFTILRSD